LAKESAANRESERLRHFHQPDDLHPPADHAAPRALRRRVFRGRVGTPDPRLTKLIHQTEARARQHPRPGTPAWGGSVAVASAAFGRLSRQFEQLRKKHLRALRPSWKRFAREAQRDDLASRLEAGVRERKRCPARLRKEREKCDGWDSFKRNEPSDRRQAQSRRKA